LTGGRPAGKPLGGETEYFRYMFEQALRASKMSRLDLCKVERLCPGHMSWIERALSPSKEMRLDAARELAVRYVLGGGDPDWVAYWPFLEEPAPDQPLLSQSQINALFRDYEPWLRSKCGMGESRRRDRVAHLKSYLRTFSRKYWMERRRGLIPEPDYEVLNKRDDPPLVSRAQADAWVERMIRLLPAHRISARKKRGDAKVQKR